MPVKKCLIVFALVLVVVILSCKTEKDYIYDLRNPDPSVRHNAVERLDVKNSVPARNGVVFALNDPNKDVRLAAVKSLRDYIREAENPSTLAEIKEPFLALVRFDKDNQVRAEVVASLAGIADEEILSVLLKNLAYDSCRAVRWESILTFGRAKYHPAVPACIDILMNDPDPDIKKASAWSLGEIGDPRAIKPLKKLSANRRWVGLWPSANEALAKLENDRVDPGSN